MTSWLHDLRFALRSLGRRPGATRLVVLVLGLGLAATILSSRLLESLLFGVEPGDVRVLAAVLATVLTAAGAAAYLPARRASLLDPLNALRHE